MWNLVSGFYDSYIAGEVATPTLGGVPVAMERVRLIGNAEAMESLELQAVNSERLLVGLENAVAAPEASIELVSTAIEGVGLRPLHPQLRRAQFDLSCPNLRRGGGMFHTRETNYRCTTNSGRKWII